MYRFLLSLVAVAVMANAAAGSEKCDANGGVCPSDDGKTASLHGDYAHDVVLMQLRTFTPMPKITWSETDPLLDEDFPEDDQPGGQDLTRPLATVSPNMTVAHLQTSGAQAPEAAAAKDQASEAAAAPEGANDASSSPSEATPGAAEVESPSSAVGVTPGEATSNVPGSSSTDGANATEGANTSGNTTTDAANASAEGNVTDTSSGCATRADDRIQSWFAAAAAPNSPCFFGLDVRDEDSHCIYDNGQFGSNGWCYTSKDRSEWGSCNEHCPLYGPPSSLGNKIDNVAKKLDVVVQKLSPNVAPTNAIAPEATEGPGAPNADGTSAGASAAEGKGPVGGGDADGGADASKGKGKGKGADTAKGKGKGKA